MILPQEPVSSFSQRPTEQGILKIESDENRRKTLLELRAITAGIAFEEKIAVFAGSFDPQMDVKERAYLAICQKMLRDSNGSDTPVEELLKSILEGNGFHGPLNQDAIHAEVDEFDELWGCS